MFAKQVVENDQVTFSDTCVSAELRAAFVKGLDRLVAQPPHGEPDWHPGSGQKVNSSCACTFLTCSTYALMHMCAARQACIQTHANRHMHA